MRGIVKWFNQQKGYGFIAGEDNNEYFVHISQVPKEVILKEGDKVSFEINQTPRGKQAKNLVVI